MLEAEANFAAVFGRQEITEQPTQQDVTDGEIPFASDTSWMVRAGTSCRRVPLLPSRPVIAGVRPAVGQEAAGAVLEAS